MPEPTWTKVEAPILEAIADFKPRLGKPGAFSIDIAEATGLEYGAITTALDRLEAAHYVTGSRLVKGAEVEYVSLHLTERGLRASGVWPSDDPFEDLVRVLNDQINREPDQERAGRLRRLLSAVMDAGRDIGVGVLTEFATRGALGR
jgi:DNA-binding PadR family transcriptional regulator